MTAANLILAGFMGVGKSTVGRLCARQLGLTFVDTDEEIVRREGMSIPAIFERHGEAYFRALERELAQELAQRGGCVIATGGGMIVNDDNRNTLLMSGVGVCLTATPDVILRRVGGEAAAQSRPMLRGDDVTARITHLLKERTPKYAQMHYHVDTSQRTSRDVAAVVTEIYSDEQARITVNIPDAGAHYDIVIGDGILDQLGFMLAGRGWNAPFNILSDKITSSFHGGRVLQAMARVGMNASIHTMQSGEAHKTLASVERMYAALSEWGAERASPVIALGGGVVGDTTGFAAATYLRGVPFVQVPTTLLAMADSSIGGKVGVDTAFGKNLVGAFKQPDIVVIDTGTLLTLPIREIRCGMAEIVKSVLISGAEPYAHLRTWLANTPMSAAEPFHTGEDGWITSDLINSLVDSILMKRAVVQEDPFEKGKRAWLNLGHTFGHGIEAWSKFQLKHGEAVALGMVCAARLSRDMGFCSAAFAEEIIETLRWAGLPTTMAEVYTFTDRLSFDMDAIWALMMKDKKKRAGRLRFVLIRAPGDVFVCDDVSEQMAKQALNRLNV
jgi:3-dehydroquinate synthase